MNIVWISYISSWTPTLLNALKSKVHIAVIIPAGGFDTYKHEEDGITYYSLHLLPNEIKRTMQSATFQKYANVFEIEHPSLIHVHGTETNFAQVQNFIKIPVIVSVQGILMGYKPFYDNYIHEYELLRYSSIKNLLGYGGIKDAFHNIDNGVRQFEEEIFNKTKYFFCRTTWDKAWVTFSNPNSIIFHGEELLRPSFYTNAHSWKVESCKRHNIFMPSGFNPIKGLYLAVKALALLKKFYEDVILVVPGISEEDVFMNFWKELFLGEQYIKYVRHLIEINNLHDNVRFLGRLTAEEMVEQMQKANVFLSPSSIDNSPNAVGEATMIGVPVVTTPVGGVTSMLEDNESCLFAPAGDEYMMAYQIRRIFEDDSLAKKLSTNEGLVANRRHDVISVSKAYIDSYNQIVRKIRND